jgi:hypothetical protein
MKIGTNIYKNKSNQISENLKHKIEKSNGEIYKRKLLNEYNNDINNQTTHIKNKMYINVKNNKSNINIHDKNDLFIKNNYKRNTDSIIQKGNKEIEITDNENFKKKESNKVKTKAYNNNTNKSKEKELIYNNYLNYTVNQNVDIKLKKNNEFEFF